MHNLIRTYDQAAQLRSLVTAKKPFSTQRPYIIVIASGKGGVGKSTIALNFSLSLSEQEKNVLLIDADSNRGSLDILLGIAPQYRLGNVLRGEHSVKDILVPINKYLTLLPGSSGDSLYPIFYEETAQTIFEQIFSLDKNYDFIVVDTPTGINNEVQYLSLLADETIVISSVEPPSIMDSYALIKAIVMLQKKHSLFLLLNNVPTPYDAEDAEKKLNVAVEHFLQRRVEYLGFLPSDIAVPQSVNEQKPWILNNSNSLVSQSLKAIIEKILSIHPNSISKVHYE